MIASYALGYTTSKEYAEMEWPIAVWVTAVWAVYCYVFFGTIAKRTTQHIYVANWFFGAFIIVTAMVHVINHVAVPVSLLKSYSMYSGATDAMIQWWYGHSVVGFILSIGFLGMMYYFVPKQADRPVYSYRLSIVCISGQLSAYTSGLGLTICITPPCQTGLKAWAWPCQLFCLRQAGAE